MLTFSERQLTYKSRKDGIRFCLEFYKSCSPFHKISSHISAHQQYLNHGHCTTLSRVAVELTVILMHGCNFEYFIILGLSIYSVKSIFIIN